MNDTDIRDLPAALLPEARTCVLTTASGSTIEHVAVSSQLVAFIDENGTISIHVNNKGPKGVQILSSVKQRGSLAVSNLQIESPVVTITPELNGRKISGANFSACGRFLFVFANAIGYIDLTSELTLRWIDQINADSGTVRENEIVYKGSSPMVCGWNYDDSLGKVVAGNVRTLLPAGRQKKEWKFSNGNEQSVSMTCDNTVYVFDKNNTKTTMSLSSGEVLNVHVTKKFVIVHQSDAISIFSIGELKHLLRDSINKTKYIAMDACESFLVVISEASKKFHLELFDISDLASLLRWDVTRLTGDECLVKFLGPSGSFVTTFANGGSGGVVWDAATPDQWYAVMPNFKMLPLNELYVETEEEFDFNQNAPDSVVRATLNRYRSLSTPELNFFQDDQIMVEDNLAEQTYTKDNEPREQQTMYPFLQPLESWKQKDVKLVRHEIDKSKQPIFFNENATRI